MSILHNSGFIKVNINPNDDITLQDLQNDQKFMYAIDSNGNRWKYVSNNPVGEKWVKILDKAETLFDGTLGIEEEVYAGQHEGFLEFKTLESEDNSVLIKQNEEDVSLETMTQDFDDKYDFTNVVDFFEPCYIDKTNLDHYNRTGTDLTFSTINTVDKYFTIPTLSTNIDFNPLSSHKSHKWVGYIGAVSGTSAPNFYITKHVGNRLYYTYLSGNEGNWAAGNRLTLINPFINWTNLVESRSSFQPKLVTELNVGNQFLGYDILTSNLGGYFRNSKGQHCFIGTVLYNDNTLIPKGRNIKVTFTKEDFSEYVIDMNNEWFIPTNIPMTSAPYNSTINYFMINQVVKIEDGNIEYIAVGYLNYRKDNINYNIPGFFTFNGDSFNVNTFFGSNINIFYIESSNGNELFSNNLQALSLTYHRGKYRLLIYKDGTTHANKVVKEYVYHGTKEDLLLGFSNLQPQVNIIHTYTSHPNNSCMYGLVKNATYFHTADRLSILATCDNSRTSGSFMTKNNTMVYLANLSEDGVTWMWDERGPVLINPLNYSIVEGFNYTTNGYNTYENIFTLDDSTYKIGNPIGICQIMDNIYIFVNFGTNPFGLKLRNYNTKEINDFIVPHKILNNLEDFPYTQINEKIIVIDISTGATTSHIINLKDPALWAEKTLLIKKLRFLNSSNENQDLIINAPSGITIDKPYVGTGANSYTMLGGENPITKVKFYSTGTEILIIK